MLSIDARPPLQRHHGSGLGGSVLGPHDHIRVHLPMQLDRPYAESCCCFLASNAEMHTINQFKFGGIGLFDWNKIRGLN